MTTDQPKRTSPQPAEARPIFSSVDFQLLRTAVLAYIRQVQGTPASITYGNLYHRLGRAP